MFIVEDLPGDRNLARFRKFVVVLASLLCFPSPRYWVVRCIVCSRVILLFVIKRRGVFSTLDNNMLLDYRRKDGAPSKILIAHPELTGLKASAILFGTGAFGMAGNPGYPVTVCLIVSLQFGSLELWAPRGVLTRLLAGTSSMWQIVRRRLWWTLDGMPKTTPGWT